MNNQSQTDQIGAQASVPQSSSLTVSQDTGIVLVAGYHFVISALTLLGTLVALFPTLILAVVGAAEDPGAFIPAFFLGFVAIMLMALTVLNLVVGYGVWTRREWGRIAALALAFLRLINIPIGTAIGGVMIWYLLREDVVSKFR